MNDTLNRTLDWTDLLTATTELADLVKHSVLASQYLEAKKQMNEDDNAQRLLCDFSVKRQAFLDCEKYGHFHPDYNRTFDEAVAVQDQLEQLAVVQTFRQAEREIDQLLFEVSKVIASSVSETIMVPNNFELESKGGCGDGGCSGKCS